MWIVLVLAALVQSGVVAFFVFMRASHANDHLAQQFELLNDEVQQKRELWARVEEAQHGVADHGDFRRVGQEFLKTREALRIEKGRITMTQAELEMLERRLCELDEISRELEANQTETREELKILRKKEEDMRGKNEVLRGQIHDSLTKMHALMAEIELTVQMQNQVAMMKTDLLKVEERIQTMLNQIQVSNDQYFSLKRRYDALDVEYAQLHQQLSEQPTSGISGG